MTERKPLDMSIESWVEQQIQSAQDTGEFDGLDGLGKPIPRSQFGEMSWLRGYLARENLAADALLPTPLRLRKEVDTLLAALSRLHSEQQVRDHVADLNRRIAEWLRVPSGPKIVVRRVNPDDAVARWREISAIQRRDRRRRLDAAQAVVAQIRAEERGPSRRGRMRRALIAALGLDRTGPRRRG